VEVTRADLAWRLLRDGYEALPRERERQGADQAFVGRLLGRRAVVVRGPEGARLFYDESTVARHGAVPPPLAHLLFGRGAVHGLDGAEHQQRKQLFLDLLGERHVDAVGDEVRARLTERLDDWPAEQPVFDQLVEVYGGAVLTWAGIHLGEAESARISRRLAETVDGFGFAGVAYARGWRARLLLNRWAARLVRETRAAMRDGDRTQSDTPLARIAARDDLDDRTAGVELLNLLRPTVAVAWPASAALSELVRLPDPETAVSGPSLRPFILECRRTQPFAPALAGRIRRPASIGDVDLHPGDRIVLDIIGTHQDPQVWGAGEDTGGPGAFDPGRFADREPTAYDYLPHGGGDPATGHRCPGEPLAVRLMEVTLREVAGRRPRVRTAGRIDPTRIPPHEDPPLRIEPTQVNRSSRTGYRTDGTEVGGTAPGSSASTGKHVRGAAE